MYNEVLYQKMVNEYGEQSMIEFSKMVSDMFMFIHDENVKLTGKYTSSEHEYESRWWLEKHNNLKQEEYAKSV
jgi:hypothetical protein